MAIFMTVSDIVKYFHPFFLLVHPAFRSFLAGFGPLTTSGGNWKTRLVRVKPGFTVRIGGDRP